MKKIFIISSVLLVVVLVFLGIYNFAFKEDVAVQKPISTEPVKTTIPAAPEKITAISDGPVLGVYVDKKTQELKYYDEKTGIVWKMDDDGQKKQQLTLTGVNGLKNVSWSADGSKVLTTVQKEGNNLFYMYDYNLQKSSLLKEGLDVAIWDNAGTKIFYKYFDKATNERTLNIANPDGSGWQKISDLMIKKIVIKPVPLTSLVSYWNFPDAAQETQLQIAGVIGGEPSTIFKGKYGADYLWAPDGTKALVSSLTEKDGETVAIGMITIDGIYSDLNIPTLASKCVWSSDNKTIYYALPGGIPDDAKMPNEYQENKFNTQDTFWKMDVTTGEKTRIIETEDIKVQYDSSDMFLSATEDALYFINKIDRKLYKMSLQ